MNEKTCCWCRHRGPEIDMVRTPSTNGRLKWSCGKCPRRRRGVPKLPSLFGADLLGRYRILKRVPCVAGDEVSHEQANRVRSS